MRKRDETKTGGKALKTINFDKEVLNEIEKRAKEQRSNVSQLVNLVMRLAVMTDTNYYGYLAKYHFLKFQEYNYMKEQCEIRIEVQK